MSQRDFGLDSLDSGTGNCTFWLYVLQLAEGNYYVGITRDIATRFKKHSIGTGSQWTALYSPLKVLRCVDTSLTSESDAARIEELLTIQVMEQFGRHRVRGGPYCMIDQKEVDRLLLGHGHWANIERSALERTAFALQGNWDEALEKVLLMAKQYYLLPSPDLRDALFFSLFGLTRYRFWHSDFDAALDSPFWSLKGILPVLLTFRDDQPVASQCQDAFCVLAGAMTRTRLNGPEFRHLFLFGWEAFRPSATDLQTAKIDRWRQELPLERNRRYDEFISVLFPGMRYLLRN